MIYTKLDLNNTAVGGYLGNQLWQIAALIGESIKNECEYTLPTDWKYKKIFHKLNYKDINCINHIFENTEFKYQEFSKEDISVTHGYFQSYKYFEHCADEVRRLFTMKPFCRIQSDICSIHVRRGDYLTKNGYHVMPTMDYYNRAMEVVNAEKYLLFSDDIAWCKENFKGSQFEFSEGDTDYQDIWEMSQCEHNIICASSFSWWGAFLNPNPEKKVVYPSKWLGVTKDTSEMMPKEWIKVDI